MKNTRLLRHAATLAVATAATLCATMPAQAADGDAIPNLGAAQQLLQSGQVKSDVSRFLVAAQQAAAAPAAGGGADGGAVGAPRMAPNVAAAPSFNVNTTPVPMYELSPDFVTGKVQPTAQNALKLSYLASRVAGANGHQAAVLLSPKDQSWQLAGIRDGDADLTLAEGGTAQAHTFSEPQIHAWYRLTQDGMVEPLNQEATSSLSGKHSVTLAAYQKLVKSRYADKLPGSSYDKKGLAGGYGLAPGASPAPDQGQAAAPTQVEPLAQAAPASSSWQPAAAGAAALLAAGGGVVYLRRRRGATGS